MSDSARPPLRVLIAGGGVAALEAVLALRALAGDRVAIELLAPGTEFVHRPSSVLAPFSGEDPPRTPFELTGVVHHRGALAAVDVTRRQVCTTDGGSLGYDRLIVATGAHPVEAVRGATLFRGPLSAGAVEGALRHARERVVFTLPGDSAWTLPLYELALLAAHELPDGPELVLVSPEPRPLDLFGPVASDAVARLLHRAGVVFIGESVAEEVVGGALVLRGGRRLTADAVIALPRLEGPAIEGLPADAGGFVEIDEHGRVIGVPHVFAAGDATSGPIKQGGLATQQADAAAEAIAAEAGAAIVPRPYRPVLRGLLLTGDAPLYLRRSLESGETVAQPRRGRPSLVSRAPLWWPSGKIAGRYLTAFLAAGGHADPAGADERLASRSLMLLLAEEDAAAGDYERALDALDAAAALSDGPLPPELEERRRAWSSHAARPAIA